jgi:hypothetical protein
VKESAAHYSKQEGRPAFSGEVNRIDFCYIARFIIERHVMAGNELVGLK